MSEYLTDDDRVMIIRKWWDTNGTTLIVTSSGEVLRGDQAVGHSLREVLDQAALHGGALPEPLR